MQAIILAAGMGKRLGELTRENTKCMVKVHEQTLIERMIGQLERLALRRIIIVIGYKGEKVRDLLGNKIHNTPIIYISNPIYDKTNNIYSLYLAKEFLVEDETILLESDLIFADSILPRLVNDPAPNLAVVAKYESWMDGTVVTLDEENRISNFIAKKAFQFDQKDSYYKTVNIYKFSKEFSRNKYVPFLVAYCKALGNNEYYEQVLKVISLLNKPDLKALVIEVVRDRRPARPEQCRGALRGERSGALALQSPLRRLLAFPDVAGFLLSGESLFPEQTVERGDQVQFRHVADRIPFRHAGQRPTGGTLCRHTSGTDYRGQWRGGVDQHLHPCVPLLPDRYHAADVRGVSQPAGTGAPDPIPARQR